MNATPPLPFAPLEGSLSSRDDLRGNAPGAVIPRRKDGLLEAEEDVDVDVLVDAVLRSLEPLGVAEVVLPAKRTLAFTPAPASVSTPGPGERVNAEGASIAI